jgi:hypothetical protein
VDIKSILFINVYKEYLSMDIVRHPLEFLFPHEIGAELIYSFVIIICSLMIYFATKEMYELSSYKGIKYFRQSFLFFAVAYFFRYFIKFFIDILSFKFDADILRGVFLEISLFIFLYSSAMAVFYLLYSVMWKKWNHSKTRIFLFNIFALLIALIGTLIRGEVIPIVINIILLIFVYLVLYVAYKDQRDKKKGTSLFVIYLLLFIFWILNVIDVMIPRFLQIFQLGIYLVSILLFMIILYKVISKTGK